MTVRLGLVVPGGQLNVNRIGVCLENGPGSVRIDLQRARFVDPAGLVVVALLAEQAARSGQTVEFTGPTSADVHTYLSRMHLGKVFDELGVAHEIKPVTEHDRGKTLCELQRFDKEQGTDTVAESLGELLAESQERHVTQTVYNALSELGENVGKHSGRPGGFMALQSYESTREVAFAVGDNGRGLLKRLQQRTQMRTIVTTDAQAIIQAVQKHVSTVEDPGRGRGLGTVVAATRNRRGSIVIASGSSMGTFQRGRSDPSLSELDLPLPGTLVYGRLSMDRTGS